MINRRHLLQGLTAFAAAPAFAQSEAAPRTLLIFLRGGYDAANLLVPIHSTHYYEQRPTIGIKREDALPVNADWGLHPALRDSIYPLLQEGQATFVPFAGTDDLTRSHFETQDTIELGGPRELNSGFMNRLANELGARQALSFTDQLPVCFRGEAKVGNAALRDPNTGNAGDARTRALLSSMYKGRRLSAQVEEGFALRDEIARELSPAALKAMDAGTRTAILSAKGFELEARRIARLMRGRVQLGFVEVGGWDTHVGQGGATGTLATRFEELGRGLAAFADEMGAATWRNTTVVVISEFGRTWRENGSRGTDHGHGSVYWVLGGGLAASSGVAGEQLVLEARNLHQGRDYPVLNEYRTLLGGLWQRQFGLSSEALARVFPGVTPRDLALV